jgi:hypothetical protein
MRWPHRIAFIVALVPGGVMVAHDEAPPPIHRREFAFGIGYGHLALDGANAGVLEEQGGLRLDIRYSFPVSREQPAVRAGVGLGLATYLSDKGGDTFEQDGIIYIVPSDRVQLTTIEPELQLSLRHPLGDNFYIEPGVAGTFLVGYYIEGEEIFNFIDKDVEKWRAGGGGRLFLRAAYTRDRWSYGLEGSYSYGWLDFDDGVGGDIQQVYVGVFFARRF